VPGRRGGELLAGHGVHRGRRWIERPRELAALDSYHVLDVARELSGGIDDRLVTVVLHGTHDRHRPDRAVPELNRWNEMAHARSDDRHRPAVRSQWKRADVDRM